MQITATDPTMTTLLAGTPTVVGFTTTDLAAAATDKIFVKIVPSTTTCTAVSGLSDGLPGSSCEVLRDATNVAIVGTCTITLDATVLPSSGNLWCYSAAQDSSGVYAPIASEGQ